MKVGTKSVLFGVHAAWWHWLPVTLAWRQMQKRWPTWWEFVVICLHDTGYIGKPEMDGPEGETHPVAGAKMSAFIVIWLAYFGWRLRGREHLAAAIMAHSRGEKTLELSLYHSRFYAARDCAEPSALCWADKLSVHFEPAWWYLLRAHLSGEVHEYVHNAPIWVQVNSRVWFDWYLKKVTDVVNNRRKAQSRYV